MRRLFQGQPSVNADNARACCIVVLARNGNARGCAAPIAKTALMSEKRRGGVHFFSQAYTIRKFLTFIAVAGVRPA